MMTLLLSILVTSPLQSQAAVLPQANVGAALNDIRLVVRQSSTPGTDEPPPGMILIPGGETLIGTDPDDVERLGEKNQTKMTDIAAETPQHTVQVDPFFLDRTEVTNLQWRAYLQATARKPSQVMVGYSWPDGKIPDGQELFPVTNVTYPEIQEFLAWCGKRLPTEEEWTRAARGDDDRVYPWGEKWNAKNVQSGSSFPQWPVAVDSYPEGASPYGVLNMSGNVFEWTSSAYVPFEGFEPIEFKVGRKKLQLTPLFNRTRKVAKGGCYVNTREYLRIDTRYPLDPRESDGGLGFRSARSLQPGLDAVRHGYRRMLPPQIPSFDALDPTDVFAKEITSYSESLGIITDYRYIAFAHPAPERGSSLSRLRRDAKDEPVTLGLLVTSEPLAEPQLPPGAYVLSWRTKGESKNFPSAVRQEKLVADQKEADRDKDKPKKQDGGEEQADPEPVLPSAGSVSASEHPAGAAAPWPGVAVDDIVEDIPFPEDKDVILYRNVNNAIVGWTLAPTPLEEEKSPATAVDGDQGRSWTISFTLDTVARKVPRFTIPVKLFGEGIRGG